MPLERAQRRKLQRRVVLVSLRDTHGGIFLQRRALASSRHPGLWDLSVTGNVMAGESLEGAALRELEHCLGIQGATVKATASLPYSVSDGVNVSADFFLAGPTALKPRLNPAIACDGMFVSADELRGFVEHQPDMLTPELAWAVRSGWVGKF